MKVLQIIKSAYRCNIEEQDDPILWISNAMKGAGLDLDILLRSSATNYLVKGQDASGLTFGAKAQTNSPEIEKDLGILLGKGIKIFALTEDATIRGINPSSTIPGVTWISHMEMSKIFESYQQIWHW